MFDFDDDANLASDASGCRIHQREQFAEAQHGLLPVELRAAGAELGQALASTQKRQFVPREVFGKPPGYFFSVDHLGCASIEKLGVLGNVGCGGYLILVADHEHAIARHHNVGLNSADTQIYRKFVRRPRVLGTIPRRSSMSDDEWRGMRHGLRLAASAVWRLPTASLPRAL